MGYDLDKARLGYLGTNKSCALKQGSIPYVDEAGLENLQRSAHLCLWCAGFTAISLLPVTVLEFDGLTFLCYFSELI